MDIEAAKLEHEIEQYLADNWVNVLADIEALVRIPSTEDLSQATPGAPYGPGPREALSQALSIAERMGLDAHDCEGHIGYADLPGDSETQIALIGHVDVVPSGPGWSVPPYELTHREGYLLGRGVADDKGPLVAALHAVHFWQGVLSREGRRFPYTLRTIFGASEETGMADIEHYQKSHADPAFIFTPDAEFPVSYGESGLCNGWLESAPIADGAIREFEGGVATNAVPGEAHVVIEVAALGERNANAAVALAASCGAPGINVSHGNGLLTVHATGRSAHASTPELGINAIGLLVDFLMEHELASPQEREFLALQQKLLGDVSGAAVGIACSDEHFGALSVVGGMVRLEEGRIRQSLDFRYPTSTSASQLERRVAQEAALHRATFAIAHDAVPFLMNPDSAAVRALLDAYNQTAGEAREAFTMKGGTYARRFSAGASFGPEKPWIEKPSWAGSMHGPDEAIAEDLLKEAFATYVRAIGNLMQIPPQD